MARIGELLVGAGLLTVEQIDQALRAQVMWGGRLGTNLVELHLVDLDQLSAMLGKQHEIPAALARHFEQADPELQLRLSPEVAERYSCVPLLRVGPDRSHVAVTSIEPLGPKARAAVAAELLVEPTAIVNAVAAELRIRYHLERVYKIPRGARYLRSRGKTVPPFPHFPAPPAEVEEVVEEVVDEPEIGAAVEAAIDAAIDGAFDESAPVMVPLEPAPARAPHPDDDSEIPVEVEAPVAVYRADEDDAPTRERDFTREPPSFSAEISTFGREATTFSREVPTLDDVTGPLPTRAREDRAGRERRRYVRTIADDTPAEPMPTASLARMKIRRIARAAADTGMKLGNTIGEGTRAIRRAVDRDKVADLAIEAIERFIPACEAAVLLVVRGETAIGWKGFCRAGTAIAEIGVPLDQPGLLPRAATRIETVRDPMDALTSIDRLVCEAMHAHVGELLVVPVTIANQVMCLLAMVVAADEDASQAEQIANATGQAFARLMRHASR